MKKFLWLIPLFLLALSSANAAEITVDDMTTDGVVTFTPGLSNMNGRCSFNWGGLKAYPIEEFFQGSTSWSADTQVISGNKRCVNMQTGIVPRSLRVPMPFINEEAAAHFGVVQRSGVSSVTSFTTDTNSPIFTVRKNKNEWNETIITAGTYRAPDYFMCKVPTNSLTLKWLKMAGIEDRIAKGYVLKMTWVTSHRNCAGISMTLDPKYLKPAPAPDPTPVNCPVGCIAAP